MGILANRIDYKNGRSEPKEAPLHDLLTEAQLSGTSRLVFVDFKNDDHYAKCVECEQHLKQHWDWPGYLFRSACHKSNGYVQETTLEAGTTQERIITHLRCLVKQVFVDEDPENKTGLRYDWYEMTITVRQPRNGPTSIICFGVPSEFHISFEQALLKVTTDRQLKSDSERITAALLEEIVRLYDESVWATSAEIRKVEKKRAKLEDYFEMMHELLRHTVHTTEVLEVAVDSLRELSRARLTGLPSSLHGPPHSDRMNQQYDFWCRLLQNFRRRSRSNESRLQNEIHLALNLVTQKDSKATIDLSYYAQKDAAAMRAIAVVTLIFLPATFVATLFGMSFFNYQKGQPWSVTSEFWIFWAVSVPLTVVTIWAWWYGQGRAHKEASHIPRRTTTFFELNDFKTMK